jgi:hypothetical protein
MENINDHLKDYLKPMEDRLTEMEEKIDIINTKLTQVVDAILGNPLTKVGGLIQDIDVMKDKIEKLERSQINYENFKNRIYWTIGIFIAVAAIIQYITTVYRNIKP